MTERWLRPHQLAETPPPSAGAPLGGTRAQFRARTAKNQAKAPRNTAEDI
jgi:hypothetical protein